MRVAALPKAGEEGGALERPELDADSRDLPVVHDGFGDAAVGDVGEELAAIEAVGVAGFGEELLGLRRIVRERRRRPGELELLGNHAAGKSRVTERLGLVDRLAVDGEIGRQADAAVRPRRLGIPLVGKDEPLAGGWNEGRELQPGRAHELFGEWAADRVGDVGLATLEHGEPRGVFRDGAEDEALDGRRLAPVRLERLQDELDPRGERYEAIGAGPHGRLLVVVVADLLDVFLGNDPAGAGGARVEGEEIGPRLLETEPHSSAVQHLDRCQSILQGLCRGASVAVVRELDVLGGHGLAVVELRPLAHDELVGEPVLGHRPRLGEARRLRVTGHRLEHRVVERVEEHVGRDDPRRLGGIEPGRRDRHVDGPRQLAFGRGGGRPDERSQEHERESEREDGSGHETPPLRRERFERCRGTTNGTRSEAIMPAGAALSTSPPRR